MPKISRFREVLGLRHVENGYVSVCTPFMTALTAASSFRAAATALEVIYHPGLHVSEVVRLAPSDIRWKDVILDIHRGKGVRRPECPRGPRNGWGLKACSAIRYISCRQGCISRVGERRPSVVETGLARALAAHRS